MKKNLVLVLGVVIGAAALVPIISLAGGSFFIDGSTGFVGVGNTTPASQLDVSGAMYSRLVTSSSSSVDWNQGNVQTMTLNSNPTLAFNNGQAGGEYKLILTQDSTGGRTVTWPDSVEWADGTPPTLSAGSGSSDVMSFIYDGTNYLGSYLLNFGNGTTTTFALTDDLISYWKLDDASGDATDSVGSDTLTNNGSTDYATSTGKINTGVSFDGSTQYFSGNLVSSSTSDISVGLWVYIPNASMGGAFFHNGSMSAPGDGFGLGVGDGDFDHPGNHLILVLDEIDWIDSGVNIGTGWHYIAITRATTTWRFYIDGSQVGSTPTESPLTPTGDFQLARDTSGAGRYFQGYEDEVGFWTRRLSASDISELYNGGAGLQYPF